MSIFKSLASNLAKTAITIVSIIAIIGLLVFIVGKLFSTEETLDLSKTPTLKVTLAKETANPESKTTKTSSATTAIAKTGTILAGQEVAVSAEIAANISNLKVSEGMVVKQGQVLATLGNSTQLKSAVSSYNSTIQLLNNAEKLLNISVQSAGVNRSTFQEQFENARINIEKAAIQLESTQTIRYQQELIQDINEGTQELQKELTPASTSSDTATLALSDAYNASETEDALYQDYLKDAIANNQTVAAKKTDDLADFQGMVQDDNNYLTLQSAELQLSSLSKQLALSDLRSEAEIINAANQIVQIRQQLESAKISLSQGQITSPISGVVTNLSVTDGDRTNPGQEMFKIVNLNQINIKLYLSANEIFELLSIPKSKLQIEVDVLGTKVPARLSYIGVSANSQTRTIPVEVTPLITKQNDKVKFIPNTFAKVSFKAPEKTATKSLTDQTATEDNFTVPATALVIKEGQILVAVVEDNEIVMKEVVLAPPIKNGRVAIKSGIADGTEILLNPPKN
jgi:multidrug efflux pump subunit AcrA (membrane-fusion protein)